MNEFQLLPDDPRLTAYALGELDAPERDAIEAAVRANPALRATVDEIRATTAHIEDALSVEAALPEIEVYQAPMSLPAGAHSLEQEYGRLNGAEPRKQRPRVFRFPQLYYVIGGLATACFAVFVAVRERPTQTARVRPAQPPVAERITYMEVDLRGFAAQEAAANEVPGTAIADHAGAPALSSDFRVTVADSLDVPVAPSRPPPPEPPSQAFVRVRSEAPPIAMPGAAAEAERARLLEEARRGAGASPPARPFGGRSMAPADAQLATSAPAPAGRAAEAEREAVQFSTFPAEQRLSESRAAAGRAQTSDTSSIVASGSLMAPHGAGLDLYPGRPVVLPLIPERPAPLPLVAHNTEAYAYQRDNDFLSVAYNPLSTFAIDVDTASYANVRRFIRDGRLPPADAVRIEELLNYFPYRYIAPQDEAPFAVSMEVAEAPWAPEHRLVRIALKARELPVASRPAASLVFLIDVSGSMDEPGKLPLVKQSMRLLLERLAPDDRVAIVTYAGNSGLALPSTPASRSREILAALDALTPGGSTNGAMGIELAYDIAKANFIAGGINRVILCTDGDFNVGVTSQGELVRLVEQKATSGVFLTVLGFGMGNYKDATLEALANRGNGNYGYIDTRREAEKLLVEQLDGTLVTIAKDVKIQVEFNPEKVTRYRLIGYENRGLRPGDFNNDKVDAGDIGAGHAVTALYEIVPAGAAQYGAAAPREVDELKYQPGRTMRPVVPAEVSNELLTVKVRYKEPAGNFSSKVEFALADTAARFGSATADFRFAAAVAGFGMILRDSPHKGSATISDVMGWATGAANAAEDPKGYRAEFIDLVRRVQMLVGR